MVAPHLRSTSVRTRHRRTPSGRTAVTYKPRKPAAARCALCHEELQGVPRRSTGRMAKLSKTQKRPERLFGGVLCANCTHEVVVDRTRLQAGSIREEDVPLTRLKYIRALRH